MPEKSLLLQQWIFILMKNHRSSREKALEVAKRIIFTRISDLINKVDTDYSGALSFNFSDKKITDRGTNINEIHEVLKALRRGMMFLLMKII